MRPTSSNTNNRHSLRRAAQLAADCHENSRELAKAPTRIASTPSALPRFLLSWAVLIRWVFITDFVEEVDLIFLREQSGPDAVDRCITPPLMR